MEYFLIFLGIIALYSFYLSRLDKKKSAEVLKNGIRYIHSNFPSLPGTERFRTYVAGAHMYEQKIRPQLHNCLLLTREPDNEYDENAIKISTLLFEQVGYIPRNTAETLSEGMDRGRQFYAIVEKVEKHKQDKHKNHYVISINEIPKVDQTTHITDR